LIGADAVPAQIAGNYIGDERQLVGVLLVFHVGMSVFLCVLHSTRFRVKTQHQ
jgi:hypothetical protein